jgi:hypothetical protein
MAGSLAPEIAEQETSPMGAHQGRIATSASTSPWEYREEQHELHPGAASAVPEHALLGARREGSAGRSYRDHGERTKESGRARSSGVRVVTEMATARDTLPAKPRGGSLRGSTGGVDLAARRSRPSEIGQPMRRASGRAARALEPEEYEPPRSAERLDPKRLPPRRQVEWGRRSSPGSGGEARHQTEDAASCASSRPVTTTPDTRPHRAGSPADPAGVPRLATPQSGHRAGSGARDRRAAHPTSRSTLQAHGTWAVSPVTGGRRTPPRAGAAAASGTGIPPSRSCGRS